MEPDGRADPTFWGHDTRGRLVFIKKNVSFSVESTINLVRKYTEGVAYLRKIRILVSMSRLLTLRKYIAAVEMAHGEKHLVQYQRYLHGEQYRNRLA